MTFDNSAFNKLDVARIDDLPNMPMMSIYGIDNLPQDSQLIEGEEIAKNIIASALKDAHKKGMCDMSRAMLESGMITFVQHQKNLDNISGLA
jgi:hypothetical protein